MQENQKICKIISEISLYILENVSGNLNVDVKELGEEVIITFVTDLIDPETKNFLMSQLSADRNIEIEEYGWELMGEGDSDDDLELVGNLINELSIQEENGKTVITLVRYE
ncbi:MAG: hypothetical protein IJA65_02895 [Acholeplasmatales bacterium]|nr:hypothetical protein [Acholeplasmatales bacterium]